MATLDLQALRPFTTAFGGDKTEIVCIVETLCKHQHREMDLTSLLHTMVQLNFITKVQSERLKRTYAERQVANYNFFRFLMEVFSYLTYRQVCVVFEMEGYKDLAEELRLKRFHMLLKYLPKRKMLHSTRTHAYYKTLKSCVDNDAFERDKIVQLQMFIDEMNSKIGCTDLKTHDRQFAMEKKVASTTLLVQLQVRDYAKRKQILDSAINAETNGLDNTSLQIVYHSKMALTEAQEGHYDEAEEHITKAKTLCASYSPCFAVTVAHHDITFTRLRIYLLHPTEENLQKVLDEGDLAVQFVHETENDVRNLWQRIILLFMVLGLLQIPPEFEIHANERKKEHVELAKHYLKEILRRSDDIEIRRKMIVCLCQAVVHEGTNIEMAIDYANQSFLAAEAGGCFRELEKINIRNYLVRLQRKALLIKILKFCSKLIIFLILSVLLARCFNASEYVDNLTVEWFFAITAILLTYFVYSR